LTVGKCSPVWRQGSFQPDFPLGWAQSKLRA
jgi:hypothetical protein